MANTKITSRVLADDAVLTANITDANVTTAKIAADAITTAKIADDVALGGNPTSTTQSAGNNTTRLATTAFVTTAISNLADSAPAALDTLNELAAAIGDDANFSTTVTNSIATKLPLAGGTMTGDLILGDNIKIELGSASGGDLQIYHDGSNSYVSDQGTGQLVLLTNSFRVNNAANSENIITAEENGAVSLFYNDAVKLATVTGGVTVTGTLTAGDGHTFGSDGDDNLLIASSANENIVIDSADDIILDADGSTITFKDGGTRRFGFALDATPDFIMEGGNASITTTTQDADFTIIGNDGGSDINALTFDMSEAGAATFNAGITATTAAFSNIITNTHSVPFSFTYNGNDGTYDKTVYYVNQNNSSGNLTNGITVEMGRITDSSSAEVRNFTFAARGGQVSASMNANGLAFGSDTATANRLDDYEEGTFNVAVTGQTTQNSLGKYTKVGNICTCTFLFNCDANATGSNPLFFGTLPFTSVSATMAHIGLYDGDATGGNEVATFANGIVLWGDLGASATGFYARSNSTGTNPYYREDILSSSSYITCTVTYRTT